MPDHDQFLLLFLRYEADLRGFLRSVVLDPHVREDLFQECALILWRQFGDYDPRQSFGAWARGIAANKLKQRRQADQRFPVAFSPETIQALLEAFAQNECVDTARGEALHECVAALPEPSRQILRWRYEQNWSCDQIAGQTGRTLEAIYRALSRLRESLETCIQRKLATKV
jgi:RNA polymerase sigma-70 factor, ECF subfamily